MNISLANDCITLSHPSPSASRRWTLTSPLPDVWRLQSDAADAGGALQILATITGQTPIGLKSLQPLAVTGDRITVPGQPESIVPIVTESGLRFVNADDQPRLEITELQLDGTGPSLAMSLIPGESLFGTGERFNGADQRGKRVPIWAEDRWCQTEGNSYLPIPFVLSSECYAILGNRYEASLFDLGHTHPDRLQFTQIDAPCDLYIFFGDNPKALFATLTQLQGRPALPPSWAYGTLVSRHLDTQEFDSPEGIREMARQMAKHDLPWDAVIVEGWDTYDVSTYDTLKKITAELARQDKKVIVYEAQARITDSCRQAHSPKAEYAIRDTSGHTEITESPHFNPADAPNRKSSSFLDVTNPQAVEWWCETVWKPLLENVGVAGAKIDFCEQVPEWDNLVLHSGQSPKGMHHRHPVQYNVMMFNLFQKYVAGGGLCWSRGGSIGAHLYPFVWCGDQLREFRFLSAVLSAILSSGLSGVPFMGHDLAGYLPAQNGDVEADVFARGVEFSCFTATMSTHGTVTRPYDFPESTVAIYRFYAQLRDMLRPYICEQATISANTGLPLVRHMFLHHPNDAACRTCDDQYYFGEDILVAPVLTHATSRSILLPRGRWVGLFDGSEFPGRTVLRRVPVPIGQIPVFVSATARSRVLPGLLKTIRTLAAESGLYPRKTPAHPRPLVATPL